MIIVLHISASMIGTCSIIADIVNVLITQYLDSFSEEEEKLYFNTLLHFISIHFKIHDTVGY